jgi:hypothetical protein
VLLSGTVYFATESAVWTGGRAFFDPDAPDVTPARAYLISASQFSDIVAQEMYGHPGRDLDLTEVLATGRAQMGPGRYETLLCPGTLDGHPVLTFTAPWRMDEVAGSPPSEAYLRPLASGLIQAHAWTREQAAAYLATRPGAAGRWTPGAVEAVLGADR